MDLDLQGDEWWGTKAFVFQFGRWKQLHTKARQVEKMCANSPHTTCMRHKGLLWKLGPSIIISTVVKVQSFWCVGVFNTFFAHHLLHGGSWEKADFWFCTRCSSLHCLYLLAIIVCKNLRMDINNFQEVDLKNFSVIRFCMGRRK